MSEVQSPGASSADWSAKATETVVQSVGKVREKTTGKALEISRVVVYGVAIAVIGVLFGLLMLVFLVRVLNLGIDAIPGIERDRAVWITYVGLGTIFTALGALIWRKRDA